MKIIKLLANIGFLGLILVLIQRYLDVTLMINTIRQIPIMYLVSGLILLISSYLLRAHRFYVLLQRENLNWTGTLKIMLQHNAINNLLPFRMGELSFPYLLRRHYHLDIAKSLKILLAIRAFDLAIMTLMAMIIVALLFYSLHLKLFTLLMVGYGAILFGGSWLLYQDRLPLKRWWQPGYQSLKADIPQLSAVSVLIWITKIAGQTCWLIPMLNSTLTIALSAILVTEGTAILPINGPLNFGSLEGANLALLIPLGLDAQTILAAILNLHLAIIMLALIGYVISLIIPNSQPKEVSS